MAKDKGVRGKKGKKRRGGRDQAAFTLETPSADLQPGRPSSRMELYSVRSTYFVIIKVRFLFQIEVLSRLRRLCVGRGAKGEKGVERGEGVAEGEEGVLRGEEERKKGKGEEWHQRERGERGGTGVKRGGKGRKGCQREKGKKREGRKGKVLQGREKERGGRRRGERS